MTKEQWVKVFLSISRDHAGCPEGRCTCAQDFSAALDDFRKEIESGLRKSQEQVRS